MISTDYINIHGKRISIQVLGEGKTLIVLLHGAGVLSPILEFKALSHLLAAQYKVLIVEHFGYGLSDCTDTERTIENITDELHQVISSLGYKRYILMGHSISGVYSLFYSHQYPDEVSAFIGIDSSVPKQIDILNTQKLNLLTIYFNRFLIKHNLLRLTTCFPSCFLPSIKGIDWSDKEKALFKQLYLNNNSNDTVLNELQNMTRNFRHAYTMKFSAATPTLFFLSSQTCKQLKQWEQIHLDMTEDPAKSSVILLKGSHFLHYSHSQQIAQETIIWVNSLNLE